MCRTRQLFPVPTKMADAISTEDLPAIKEQWTFISRHFLDPTIAVDSEYIGDEAAFHCYIHKE